MQHKSKNDFFKARKANLTGGWMVNVAENKLTLGEKIYQIFGVDKNKLDKSYNGILRLIHPEDVRLVTDFSQQVLNAGEPDYYRIEHRIIRPNGEVRILNEILKTGFDENDQLSTINGTLSDVTEKRLNEKKLIKSEERYRSIFECSLAMLITVDNDRKITGFNPEAYKKFGYTPDEIINKDISVLYENPDDELKVSQALTEKGKFYGKVKNIRKNGEVFAVQLSASKLYDGDGNQIGTVGSSLELK
ncbi:MAG: PAS domain-containing protein [Deltaproteobacteria bacterium]|nr:PAS domain-containing protein [Deltaproteobacteria bacterium]MBW2219431.1 PAS domain-containing protein [Deltaproteobacteria bacterium]